VGAAPALALAAVLGAGGDLGLEVGLRGEGQATSSRYANQAATTLGVVVLTPTAAISLLGPDQVLRASYAADLRRPDLFGGGPTGLEMIHRGDARGETRIFQTWRLSASAAGAYGRTDLFTEVRRDPTTLEPMRTTSVIELSRLQATLGATGDLDRRTSLTASAQAYLSGGANSASRLLYPESRGVQALASVAWKATRTDLLTARLSADASRISSTAAGPGSDAAFLTLAGIWRHRFDRDLEGWAGGGAAGSSAHPPGRATAREEVMPVAQAGLAWSGTRVPLPVETEDAPAPAPPAPRLHASVLANLAPTLDRYTGQLEDWVSADVEGSWRIDLPWTLSARGRAAASGQRGIDRSATMSATVDLSWSVTRQVSASFGTGAVWQRSDPVRGLPQFTEYRTILAVTYGSGPL
jgi:hypothetical protein